MLDDESNPRRPDALTPAALESMSVEELEARVAALQADIAACERLIASKRAQRNAADALFKSAGDSAD